MRHFLLMSQARLKTKDIIILGLMNFALFVGAGNIIFPPFIGLMAGSNVWDAARGFLLTGVGLPVVATIAMAMVGGNLPEITAPLGRFIGTVLIIICYLCVGPLGAEPRTATASYELGILPFWGSESLLWLYSLIFFLIVVLVSLYPQRLFETVGKFLSPLKVVALIVLSITVFVLPAGAPGLPKEAYLTGAFSEGVKNGYLTMDTLASLVFGLVIVGAIRSRGVVNPRLITRYAVYSGIIAGIALTLIYLSLFRLGTASTDLAMHADNGAKVLTAYVGYSYGIWGNVFLGALITLACLVTAIGLTCSGGSYFSALTGMKYSHCVWILAMVSMVVSNLGLTHLIAVSTPVMEAIYPVFIILIVVSFLRRLIKVPSIVAAPAAFLAFAFGVITALNGAGLLAAFPDFYLVLPLSAQGLPWLVPCAILLLICWGYDAVFSTRRATTIEHDISSRLK